MEALYPKKVLEALATVTYAGTKKNLVESEMIGDTPSVGFDRERNVWSTKVVLVFERDTDPFLKSTVKAAEAAIKYHCGKDVEVEIETEFKRTPCPEVGKLLPDVKNIIAVSSGREVSVSRRYRQTWRLHWHVLVIRWDCSTVTFSVRR